MNHKELTTKLALKMNLPKQEVERLIDAIIESCIEQLSEGKTIGIQGFGNLEVRKRDERLSVHPATQVRTLVPPKLIVNFKQSQILKDKLKTLPHYD